MATTSPNKPQVSPQVQEFSIRVPKVARKKHNVMRFNQVVNIDFKDWKQVKLERENNARDSKNNEEAMPKFGAGSEFGRDAREEARKKKYGITKKGYRSEDQPWMLKLNGKSGRKFRGVKEGGFSDNAAYYVFTHAADGAIEAFPLNEWYNFQPVQRYKALSAEEAEEEFTKRNRHMNFFALMYNKRARNEVEKTHEDELEAAKSKKTNKKDKDLKISEMDEWMDSDDDDDDDSGSDKEEKKPKSDEDSKKKNKKKNLKKKKKKNVSDDEAFEESDDGDEEGRECDYMSESSASESELEEQQQIKSVAEEGALRKLLASDEEDEDEENKEKKDGADDQNEDEDKKDKDAKDKDKISKDEEKKKDKKKKKKQNKKDGKKASNSSSGSSSDSDSDLEKNKDTPDKKPASTHSSRSATPVPSGSGTSDSLKRNHSSSPDLSQAKKLKLDNFNLVPTTLYIPGASESGVTEEAVRRYLMRKPMTTTELLHKFKSKKTGLTSEQLVNVMTQILKKINPTKQTIKNKMYLSIKAQPRQPQL